MIDKKTAKLLDETTNGKWREFVDEIEGEDDNVKPLHSVGCVLVTEGVGIGMTYPMLVDGSWEENQSMGVHLEDSVDEWYDNLNPEDNIIVQDVLFELNPNRLDKENI